MTTLTKNSATLSQHPGFLAELPVHLEIPANTEKIILTNTLTTSQIIIHENSNIIFVSLLKNGLQQKEKIQFNFTGQNSTLTFIALIIGNQQTQFEFETISKHTAPHTNAYYYLRSVLFDHSKVNYKGTLVIDKLAQMTDSYLAHHTLMLSPNAKVDTEPCLEIEADDVKAGHAATIGRVDDDLLFYLESRGINRREAQQILIQGFMEAELQRIPDEELRQILAREIETSLPVNS